MKNKKIFLILIIVLITTFMFNVQNVYAGKDPTCRYQIMEGSEDTVDFWYEDIDSDTPTIDCKGSDNCMDLKTYFSIEKLTTGTTMYCPESIYLIPTSCALDYNLGKVFCGDASVSDSPIKEGEGTPLISNLSGKSISVEIDTMGSATNIYTYPTQTAKGEKITNCRPGGIAAADKLVKEIEDLIKEVNDITTGEALVEASYSYLQKSNYLNYCNQTGFVGDSKFAQTYKQLETAINTKRSELDEVLTDTQKNVIKDNIETVQMKQIELGTINTPSLSFISDGDRIYGCSEILDNELIEFFEWLLKIVGIGVPIILVIMVAVDLGGAVISQDQDALKKATSKSIKRIIAAIAVFFIPYIVGVILRMEGISSYIKGDDSTCDL